MNLLTWIFRRRAIDQPATGDRRVVPVRPGLGIAPVDQLILLECRVERHVQHATLLSGVDSGEAGDRLGHLLPIGADDAHPSGPLGHEHLAVRQEGKAPGVDEPFGDRHHVERDVEPLFGCTRLPAERWLLAGIVRWTNVDAVFRPATRGRSALSGADIEGCSEGNGNGHCEHGPVNHSVSLVVAFMVLPYPPWLPDRLSHTILSTASARCSRSHAACRVRHDVRLPTLPSAPTFIARREAVGGVPILKVCAKIPLRPPIRTVART